MDSDDRLSAELAQLPDEAREALADFLRASSRPNLSAGEAEIALSESLTLKDVLSASPRQ